MRINPRQLQQSLSKGLMPIYVVTGDEPLIVQECCDSIRAAARNGGFSERELLHAEHSFDWGQLLSSAGSMSLFAEKKIIELRLPGGKPGDKGSKALQEFAALAGNDLLLLLVLPRLDRSQLNSKWIKALEQNGVLIQVWPVEAAEMPRWIHQRLRAAGLDAEPEAIQILADRVEGNLLAASQEIEKLKLLGSDKLITADLMRDAVASSARYDVFNLIDRALAGDAEGAVKTLQGLRAEGVEAPVVLWALAREIRSLLEIGEKLDRGQPIARLVRIPKRQPLVQSALARLTPARLESLLLRARAVDTAIKGGRDQDPWIGLLELALNLSGKRSI
ncbi:DNA polymerase III subunit delta [Microbulbifer thermotolerans]|uniref:DNA polymerase III subunit delta n=1 Tax=Microbulbifer thermotolerans TaxID=252514 RepID=A0A143HJR1_MICTH|nr:DNA polymerase III subunit delta [Microbulbifer thermotolerans]AMX01965.1 DNA polymerase III subunit delta [Microbulbifer thermotolerans]MCX2783177.1 DNA polymerase III subunit delta [Microbulbifer thermotolerans]MCX2794221.1 DNA polymerase III subunit delta [Microbulbifer thermotolerans]MCX2800757.1 DNA polymerase III subunit delta [Microbulbifer thermotolerans]MCX2829982.1 DNA polymerase III subunit delta [Microbulbifer thermotolerans]